MKEKNKSLKYLLNSRYVTHQYETWLTLENITYLLKHKTVISVNLRHHNANGRYYDPRYITREQGQMLIIPHVRESDNGEYCCIATNGIGEPAKSCGALQLKMSMSAFFLRFYT